VRGSQGTLLFDDTQAWGEKLVFYNQKKNHPYKVDHPVYEPLKNECIHFLQSCELRASPLTDSLEATRVIEVLEMAQKELLQINQSFCHQKQIFSSLTLN
jgi:UDP-2-acetamido-3-amino-2,3-dideoxy-glucuronate N-acetyltransferase